jgi:hypothetical protein
MVLRSQVGSEKADGREVDGPLRKEVEDDREAAGGTRGLDAVVGLVLGEAEDGATVGEERGVALAEVDVADVHLGEVGDDLHGDLPRAAGEDEESGDEVAVGEVSKRVEQFVRHRPSCSTGAGRNGSAREEEVRLGRRSSGYMPDDLPLG